MQALIIMAVLSVLAVAAGTLPGIEGFAVFLSASAMFIGVVELWQRHHPPITT